MRKAFIALAVVIAGLLVALFLFNQEPKYAGVSLSQKDYQHVQASKKQVKAILSDLKLFNTHQDKSLTELKKDADALLKSNQPDLGPHDYNKLKEALYGPYGIVTSAENAKARNYQIDVSVASSLRGNFETLIVKSISSINKNSIQRETISNQLIKDLNLDQILYQIGSSQE
ncbi:molecular chaperone [Convivina intestini]|uniref:Uncharacterized protein n=1 Tax=Convivina intestini TaxID=1505726 RepID=A0A2U1D3W0_9LACO|nr:molecular chaperone [Convivina intestini]PVY82365.1 hypothetical protein C7384_11321 [Convivina intestini]CAH1854556.1 hypothetical protein R078131_00979 [Convivina intestini]CAH1857372.1 hypothetical protein R077811_01478 [Convivina intestini]SDC14971.1 hypothetical protein SAMN05216341_11521 [Leuconostocaceae bacterium R-53105]